MYVVPNVSSIQATMKAFEFDQWTFFMNAFGHTCQANLDISGSPSIVRCDGCHVLTCYQKS